MRSESSMWEKTKEVLYREVHADGHRPCVFIGVEHDQMRGLIATMMRGEGYDVVEAQDGPELVQALIRRLRSDGARAPDLIILDARLPGWSGVDVVKRLRRFDHTTPVLLLGADGKVLTPLEQELLQVDAALQYPFDYAQLCELATSLVQR